MRYFKVKTTSHTKKKIGYQLFWARNEDAARAKMKRMRLPVYEIVEIMTKESVNEYLTDNPQSDEQLKELLEKGIIDLCTCIKFWNKRINFT